MPLPRTSDQEVGALVHRIARFYLEVERGMRPPPHLQRLLTPAEYARHRQTPAQDRLAATGPVVPSDIGRISFDRDKYGNVTASVPTREDEGRWGSLVIHLLRAPGGWAVDYIQRVPRRGLSHDEGLAPEPTDLDERMRSVDSERKLVEAARAATTRRLRELTDRGEADPSALKDLREQRARWTRLSASLEQELCELRRQAALSAMASRENGAEGPRSRDAENKIDARLVQVLGPMPQDEEGRSEWNEARQKVNRYRRRWGITGTGTLLGPEATRPDQQRERDHVAQVLLRAARTLGDSAEPTTLEHEPGPDRERPFGIDL